MRRVSASILVLCLALAAGAAIAPAKQKKRFRSHVTIERESSVPAGTRAHARRNVVFTFYGEVTSRKPRCERNRTVELFDANETAKGEEPESAGTAKTDAKGQWSVSDPNKPPADTYYAVVAKRKFGKPGRKKVCKADTSPDFAFDGTPTPP